MNLSKAPIIAVVTALANGFAEKELLSGIISENKKNGFATVVFSNIYNTVQQNDNLMCEQEIYDLIRSPDISGIILLCESFVEGISRRRIASVLAGRDIPIVGIGTRLAEFEELSYTLFSTDDADDVAELTSHLIEKHGFTDIDFLTGLESIEASHIRTEGYIKALEAHGITPDRNRIFFGDFWLGSGEQLAQRYISGELRMPQAVICASDMMAYGMLRRFADAHINVPEQITVVSYEYSDRRMYYSPPLTCFRKNRRDLGRSAALHLQHLIEGLAPPAFIPPRGSFVFGRSCPCRPDNELTLAELRNAEQRRDYTDLSLFSTMEQLLTLARDMESFIRIVSEHQWLIRNKRNIYLSLFSDWNEQSENKSGIMRSVSVISGSLSSAFETDRFDLRTFFAHERDAAVCYFNPLFSGQKLFGYMAILYDTPESYDDVYRHWLKSVSIGLEFLRLKNDIRYLISCQNVSEYRDTLTGMNNEKGLRRAYQAIRIHDNKTLFLTALRIDLFPHQFTEEDVRSRTDAFLGAARAISKFCGNHDVSGRIGDDLFICIVQSLAAPEMISDLLSSVLIQERAYISYAGMNSFACCTIPCGEDSFDELMERAEEALSAEQRRLSLRRNNRYYSELLGFRNRIYTEPETTFDRDSDNVEPGHIDSFRRNYKSCFGITFHQDCINARLAKAKYYLATTSLSISDISEKCSYLDYKYFQRQFAANVGIPALQYRNLIKG